ncbi:MAG: hypothetical protein MJ231_08670, partial [bacterium]|nr:hypothetical protein [bacterium]
MIKLYPYSPKYTKTLLSKIKPLATIPAGLLVGKACMDLSLKNTTQFDIYEKTITLSTEKYVENSVSDNSQANTISDEEFEKQKKLLVSKINQDERLNGRIKEDFINKANLILAEKLAKYPEFVNNTLCTDDVDMILETPFWYSRFHKSIPIDDIIKARTSFIDRIVAHQELLNITGFTTYISDNICSITTPEIANARADLIDKVCEHTDLITEDNLPISLKSCMQFVDSKDAKAKIDILDMLYRCDYPTNIISKIFSMTREGNIIYLMKLCNSHEIPKLLIGTIIDLINNNDCELLKELCDNLNIDNMFQCIKKAYKKDHNKLSYLCSTDLKMWIDENLKNGLSIDEIIDLSHTQDRLIFEKQSKQNLEVEPNLLKQKEKLSEICAYPKIAEHYLALCQTKGKFDEVKFNAVYKLAENGVKIKDCKFILALATGNHLSEQEGIFRPQIIDDIVTIRQNGLKNIIIATILSAVKNMPEAEFKSRFNNDM